MCLHILEACVSSVVVKVAAAVLEDASLESRAVFVISILSHSLAVEMLGLTSEKKIMCTNISQSMSVKPAFFFFTVHQTRLIHCDC